MKKICFVVQRYGEEVNGGAELQCKQFAEHLVGKYDVSVVTTKAIEHTTWKNEYLKEEEEINGVKVLRFPVDVERNLKKFNKINDKVIFGTLKKEEEREWLEKQGPYTPKLIEYLKKHKEDYDVFFLMTYLYYPTVESVSFLGDKAILIPEAHEEPYIHMECMKEVFTKPRFIFFNTEEEKKLVHHLFKNKSIPCDIGGIGIEVPNIVDVEGFKKKYEVGDYLLYVGRIDAAKNCAQLFDYFKRYKKERDKDLKLLLVGRPAMDIPKDSDIIPLGFISDAEKFAAIAGAKVFVLPSEMESLSIVVLESMIQRTSVIVNGKCPVLKGHCKKSNGAFYYNNYEEFAAELDYLDNNPDVVEIMKDNAQQYVNDNYTWKVMVEKLSNMIELVSENRG